MSKQRRRYEPSFEDVGRWAFSYSARNLWRVAKTHDLDDLLQDARVVYLRVAARYQIQTRAHLQGLFSQSFKNHIHDLTRRQWRRAEAEQGYERARTLFLFPSNEAVTVEDLDLAVLVSEVVDPVELVLSLGFQLPENWRRTLAATVGRMSKVQAA